MWPSTLKYLIWSLTALSVKSLLVVVMNYSYTTLPLVPVMTKVIQRFDIILISLSFFLFVCVFVVSGEQPRSKISSHRESLGVGAEQPRSKISSHRESLGVGDEQPRSKISSHRESSGVGIEQPRSKFSYGDIGGVVTDVRGEGEIGEGVYGGDEGFLIEHTTSTDDSQPPAINERSVQFMWQPMTHHINCPSVTLLASFQVRYNNYVHTVYSLISLQPKGERDRGTHCLCTCNPQKRLLVFISLCPFFICRWPCHWVITI